MSRGMGGNVIKEEEGGGGERLAAVKETTKRNGCRLKPQVGAFFFAEAKGRRPFRTSSVAVATTTSTIAAGLMDWLKVRTKRV